MAVVVALGCGGRGRVGDDDDDSTQQYAPSQDFAEWSDGVEEARDTLGLPVESSALAICSACLLEGLGGDNAYDWALAVDAAPCCTPVLLSDCRQYLSIDGTVYRSCCEWTAVSTGAPCVQTDSSGACMAWED